MVTQLTGDNSTRNRIVSVAKPSSPVSCRIPDCHCASTWSMDTLFRKPPNRHYIGPDRKATGHGSHPSEAADAAHCSASESENTLGVGLIHLAEVRGAYVQTVRHRNSV